MKIITFKNLMTGEEKHIEIKEGLAEKEIINKNPLPGTCGLNYKCSKCTVPVDERALKCNVCDSKFKN